MTFCIISNTRKLKIFDPRYLGVKDNRCAWLTASLRTSHVYDNSTTELFKILYKRYSWIGSNLGALVDYKFPTQILLCHQRYYLSITDYEWNSMVCSLHITDYEWNAKVCSLQPTTSSRNTTSVKKVIYSFLPSFKNLWYPKQSTNCIWTNIDTLFTIFLLPGDIMYMIHSYAIKRCGHFI